MMIELTERKRKVRQLSFDTAKRLLNKKVLENIERNKEKEKLEFLSEVLYSFVNLVYIKSENGKFLCVNGFTGRLTIACPWGSAGHKYWGLVRSERDFLNKFLKLKGRAETALFYYVHYEKTWYLNIKCYPTVIDASKWLDENQLVV